MKPFEISIEQYRGDAYKIGYDQGKQMKKSLFDMFSKIIHVGEIDITGLKNTYSAYAPHLLDEMRGIADAMAIPFEEAALFSGYGAPKVQGMGCSSIVNREMLVRNYDFSPELYDARLVLTQPNEGYASVGHSLHAMGRTEGVNEKGLAVALHFVNNEEAKKGLTAGSVIRILLDTCKTTDEAVNMIKKLPHAWSYNFSIGDATGYSVVVEQSPSSIKVRRDERTLLCTNHFQQQAMHHLNRENLEGTEGRLNFLKQHHNGNQSAEETFNMFKDTTTPLYNEAYHEFFGTLHTFMYRFEDHFVFTAIPNGDVLNINFKEWVQGKNLTQTKLTGHLNYP